MPIAAACERGFRTQGGVTRAVHSWMALVIHGMHELGAADGRRARAGAHRELVAERAARRFAHAGHVQVLAEHRGGLDVEVVQRDDAVEALGAGEERRALADVGGGHVAVDVVERVDGVARPVGVAQLLLGQEQHAAALAAALAQELVPLVVGRDAQHGQGHVRRFLLVSLCPSAACAPTPVGHRGLA